MALHVIKDLPTALNVDRKFPVSEELHHVSANRKAIQRVFTGEDTRTLAVVGPCSAWPSGAVENYSHRLKRLAEKIEDRVLVVLRTYIQKPRTTVGWPGPLNQPDPLGVPDIEAGIWYCREMMHKAAQLHPLADEMLFTHNAPHFVQLLSYIALGARSAEDMEHRYIASGFDCPVGVKNSTSGDIQVGVNGVQCVQSPHVFALHNQQVQSGGNPHAHLVLRGGGGKTNYDGESIREAADLLVKAKVKNPSILVDASHDNSLESNGNGNGKNPLRQLDVIDDVLAGMREGREGYQHVKGVMLESFLRTGKQIAGPDMALDGLSITDPCIGWDETVAALRKIADENDRAQ